MANIQDRKNQILSEFQKILTVYKQSESRIKTKEETAQKAKNQEVVVKAATYTVDSIVKGMADLQLEVGKIVQGLAEKLTTENDNLTAVKEAIDIESTYLEDLKKIRIVADTLDILSQEHQEKLKTIEQQLLEHREKLTQTQIETRQNWEKEAAEFIENLTKLTELTEKEREKERSDYQYQIERERQLNADEYNTKKRQQEWELESQEQNNLKGWAEREKFLNDHQKILTENETKVAGFSAELEEAIKKAREEAIKEISNEMKVKADLVEKEWESTKQTYEYKIQSLEQVIDRQNQQITELTNQLQAVLNQAQSLALKAFDTSVKLTEKTS